MRTISIICKSLFILGLFTFVTGMTTTVQAMPAVTDGLVAAYEFTGNSNDISDNEFDAVNHGAVLVADRFGNSASAYRFDGNEWLSVTGLIPLSSYTFSGWVNWDSISGWRPFIDESNGWSSDNVRFEIRDSKLSLSDRFSSDISISTGEWYQIAVTYDNSSHTIDFYFNGTSAGSVNSTMPGFADNTDHYFEMGRGLYGGDEYLNGFMDDIYIYDRALTASEINNLYNQKDPATVPIPTTILLLASGLIALTFLQKKTTII